MRILRPALTCLAASLFLVTTAVSAEKAPRLSVVRIALKGETMMRALDREGIDLINFNGDGTINVLADDRQVDFLFSLGFPASVIETPETIARRTAPMAPDLGAYTTYDELTALVNALGLSYPAILDISTIGTSIEGRAIHLLKISDNPTSDESEPEVLYFGNTHAREIMTVEIPLKFAIYLLENYGIDATVTAMVNEREIFIVPMLNPDGHVFVENNKDGYWGSWWRKNRRNNGDGSFGVDLNRNFGYQWGYDDLGSSPTPSNLLYRGPSAFSEPETNALRLFANARNFVFQFSFHSYGELFLYPWGYITADTNDHEVYDALGQKIVGSTGYRVGNGRNGTIYITNGASDDWGYGETGEKNSAWSFTWEVNSFSEGGFGPSDLLIQPTFDMLLASNMEGLLLADNPYKVLGPYAPALAPITDGPGYLLSWSAADPIDPNPPTTYDIIEYDNLHVVDKDGANSMNTDRWQFNGWGYTTARPFTGSGSYYSSMSSNGASVTLDMANCYQVTAETDTFECRLWYNIESHYDYAYFEISTDNGGLWTPLAGNVTTNTNPNGGNTGNGITGASSGWPLALFPLTSYLGQTVKLRFNYVTDGGVLNEGIYVDNCGPLYEADATTLVATGLTGTIANLVAPAAGPFTYQVRAIDADGDEGHWSNLEHVIASSPTGIGGTPGVTTALQSIFPNPFNPATTVGFTLASRQPVTLAVYNVRGALVRTLYANDALDAGPHVAEWNGRTNAGAPAPSGVYFFRLIAGEFSQTRKAVLLK